MEVVNATPLKSAYTLGLDPDGRERVVLVVKGSYAIPRDGTVPVLCDDSAPLTDADEFTGEPGLSAITYESDFAPHKPQCDVLLLGSAYAPGGRAVSTLQVVLRVGSMSKAFEVVGDRYWTAGGGTSPVATRAAPFVRMPISYDNAYGGTETLPDPSQSSCYRANPVGRGYFRKARAADIFGNPAPNTAEIGEPINTPGGRHRPMAFGPVGRNFEARVAFAGTYDDAWLETTYPFLPADFDYRYFQAAPVDQQIAFPRGGEVVALHHLMPEPIVPFPLPDLSLPVEFTDANYRRTQRQAVVDTILLEPDQGRFQLVWRTSMPLKRNLMEMRQVVIGTMSAAWYRARAQGKMYYPSLGELVRSRPERGE